LSSLIQLHHISFQPLKLPCLKELSQVVLDPDPEVFTCASDF
jgi:hypothetical protein